MRFTIVTPLLNAERHVRRLIETQRLQDYADWEHVFVDGGSDDGGPEAVRDAAARDGRFRLLAAPGSSIYEALFEGFANATGEMLCWINADDAHTPWALETVAQFHAETGASWMTGFPAAWDEAGRLRYVRPQGLYPRSFIRKGYFHGGLLGFLQAESMFFRRDLFARLDEGERRGVLEARLAGDYRLWRALAALAPLSVVPSVLGGFCQHGQNRSVTEAASYMEEVHATGTWQPPRWLGRRLGKSFQMLSALKARRLVELADAALQRELAKAAETPSSPYGVSPHARH